MECCSATYYAGAFFYVKKWFLWCEKGALPSYKSTKTTKHLGLRYEDTEKEARKKAEKTSSSSHTYTRGFNCLTIGIHPSIHRGTTHLLSLDGWLEAFLCLPLPCVNRINKGRGITILKKRKNYAWLGCIFTIKWRKVIK